ncbi:uncharacterized protein G2W53_006497 [Senna tora]|uniref:Uncharacterized protein n=1 Tax=Senna tora TaxID=362788 RepID=A0A834X574_9FABA|nr:uncharacterized protein G2W53_006497 [Senna tora]
MKPGKEAEKKPRVDEIQLNSSRSNLGSKIGENQRILRK